MGLVPVTCPYCHSEQISRVASVSDRNNPSQAWKKMQTRIAGEPLDSPKKN